MNKKWLKESSIENLAKAKKDDPSARMDFILKQDQDTKVYTGNIELTSNGKDRTMYMLQFTIDKTGSLLLSEYMAEKVSITCPKSK